MNKKMSKKTNTFLQSKNKKNVSKKMITESMSNIEDYFDFYYLQEKNIHSLPETRRNLWLRLDLLFYLSNISFYRDETLVVNPIQKRFSKVFLTRFFGVKGTKRFLTSSQLIDGIEKYIPHLLIDTELEKLEEIKKCNSEVEKLRLIYCLTYRVFESMGSYLYMKPDEFVKSNNISNPFWKWSIENGDVYVSKDSDLNRLSGI